MRGRLGQALLAFVAVLAGACSVLGDERESFTEGGLSFRYPTSWHVSGFSTTNSPPRLVVTSYPVPQNLVEGDCGGYEATELMPPHGAFVLVIDYSQAPRGLRPEEPFPPRPSGLTLQDGEFHNYECFGASAMFRFRLAGRDLQAHVGLGSEASNAMREEALAVLSSIEVAGAPAVRGLERDEFAPTTHREGDRVDLPVAFPDGSTAELVYPPQLSIAEMGNFPYSSGWLRGKSPTGGRGDLVGRDFVIRYGTLEELLTERNQGGPARLLAAYTGADGKTVGLWDLETNDTVHYLGYQFGR